MKNKPLTAGEVAKLPNGFTVTTFAPTRKQKVAMARQLKLMKRNQLKAK
jgi:hypothetical protein